MSEPTNTFLLAIERPALIVKSVLQMILGAGLVVALIVKVYMLVLTDLVCTGEGASLGEAIRCTDTLQITGYVFALAAGIEGASLFFRRAGAGLLQTLMLAVAAALFIALSGQMNGDVNWRLSLAIFTLAVLIAGIFYGRMRMGEGIGNADGE